MTHHGHPLPLAWADEQTRPLSDTTALYDKVIALQMALDYVAARRAPAKLLQFPRKDPLPSVA